MNKKSSKKPLKISEDEKIKKVIREDLNNQLTNENKFGKFYKELIEDYIYMYGLSKKLQRDINKKGLRYKVINGNGIESTKPNESIINLVKINSQMLKILSDLDLKAPELPPTPESGEGEDEYDDLC